MVLSIGLLCAGAAETHLAEETVADSLEEFAENRQAALEKFAEVQLGANDSGEVSSPHTFLGYHTASSETLVCW